MLSKNGAKKLAKPKKKKEIFLGLFLLSFESLYLPDCRLTTKAQTSTLYFLIMDPAAVLEDEADRREFNEQLNLNFPIDSSTRLSVDERATIEAVQTGFEFNTLWECIDEDSLFQKFTMTIGQEYIGQVSSFERSPHALTPRSPHAHPTLTPRSPHAHPIPIAGLRNGFYFT